MDCKLTGHIYVEETYDEGILPEVAVEDFRLLHGILPETINDTTLVGRCTGCQALVLDGDQYASSEEGDVICIGCGNTQLDGEVALSDEACISLC